MIAGLEHLEPGRVKLRRWIATGTMVAALHVGGGAMALWQSPEEEPDAEVAGAMMIELAPMAIAPREERQDIALGAPAEESAPTPPVEEVQEVKPEEDIPPLPEVPLTQAPEVTLPKVEPVREVEEKEEKKEKQEATAASQAAAPPPIEAQEGPKPAAPQRGNSKKPSQTQLSWQKALNLHLGKHKRYPSEARSRGVQGVVTVGFKIDATGRVMQSRVVNGSGSHLLDEEALAILERASPLPTPPEELRASSPEWSLPIQFNIK